MIDQNGNYMIGKEQVDKWNALPENYEPNDLVDVPLEVRASGCENREMKLRSEALEAFLKMLRGAEEENIKIRCVSAYRSFSYQQTLYDRACEKEGKEQASTAKPGYSEHQLGTVVDVSSPEIEYGLLEDFSLTDAFKWIEKNAHLYGFYISYTKENHKEKGYIWEPWHLRFWGKTIPES